MTYHRPRALLLAILAFALVGSQAHSQRTGIHRAAHERDLEAVRAFVENNPTQLRKMGRNKESVLQVAVSAGGVDVVRYLLEKGADPNLRTYNRFAPLHLVHNPEMAIVLIEHGADLEAVAVSGTPLEKFAAAGNVELAKVLLGAGAELTYSAAIQLGRVDQVREMLRLKPALARTRPGGRFPVYLAARAENLELVELLVAKDAVVQAADPDMRRGHDALARAARRGQFEIAEFLLAHGADPTGPGEYDSESVLSDVIKVGTPQMLALMIRNGAKLYTPSLIEKSLPSPLHMAAATGEQEKVEILLTAGHDPGALFEGLSTAFCAASNGHADAARLLLSVGAVPDIHTAAVLGDLDQIDQFLKGDPTWIETEDSRYGRSALVWAICGKQLATAERLLAAGADVNTRAGPRNPFPPAARDLGAGNFWGQFVEEGDCPLHLAASIGDEEMVRLLTEQGADIDARNKNGDTVLQDAVSSQVQGVVAFLLSEGADPNTVNKHGRSPLLSAASTHFKSEILELLLSNGADPNDRSYQSRSVISHAATSGRPAAVAMLARFGADLDFASACALGDLPQLREITERNPKVLSMQLGSRTGQSGIEIAARAGQIRILEYMLENGPEGCLGERFALHAAAGGGHSATVAWLLEQGLDPNQRGPGGYCMTPLHVAARDNQAHVIGVLLEAGAKLEARTSVRDSTPLLSAAFAGSSEATRVLLEFGADSAARNSNGRTPLHANIWKADVSTAMALLNAGAEINAENYRGETPLQALERSGALFIPYPPLFQRDLAPLRQFLLERGGR